MKIAKKWYWVGGAGLANLVWLWLCALILHFIDGDSWALLPMIITWLSLQAAGAFGTVVVLSTDDREFE